MSAHLTPEIRESIYEVLDYLWSDAKKEWEESGQPDSHIFLDLRLVDFWLAENTGGDDD